MVIRLIVWMLFTALFAGAATASESKDPYGHLQAGRYALDRGLEAEAYRHFLAARAYFPERLELVENLLALAAKTPDAHLLWSHVWYDIATGETQHVQPAATIKELLVPDPRHAARIAKLRRKAIEELLAFAGDRQSRGLKNPQDLLVAHWARRLALELSQRSLGHCLPPGEELSPFIELPARFHEPVIKALEKVLKKALPNRRTGEALRAARCLHGLGVQAGYKDLQGPRPKGMERIRRIGGEGMARARAQLSESKAGEPRSLEDLEWLDQEEGESFTRDHRRFSKPGVVLSPNGLYRIETDCGLETLLGVAQTVEYHHRRLVNWFGQDPFVKRPGLVRIVHEARDLEAEGSPFWWAGGFQGGDTTCLRFSCGRIEALGRGLTHELTHRFDGAVYPGLPAWLLEGRAVWTGAAYVSAAHEQFVPDHALFGTIENAFYKGYGGEKKLRELIAGTVEDYRDNYVAGYALYLYLATWEEPGGRKPYSDALQAFMEGAAKGNKKPKAWFARNFLDGKDGRPKSLKEFAEGFQRFVAGFYWKDRKPWTERYQSQLPDAISQEYVYDEPTWTWEPVRAEPVFGQGQAQAAAFLLLELDRREAAIRALVWTLAVDGPVQRVEAALEAALAQEGHREGVFAMRRLNGEPAADRAPKTAPFRRELYATLAFAKALHAASEDYAAGGFGRAAGVLAAEEARLCGWLGLDPGALRDELRSAFGADNFLVHPVDDGPFHAGCAGWLEEGLTGFEEFREEGLWYAAENSDLHVGRHKPRRSATGRLDRHAHRRHAFTRSRLWLLPGAYRLSTRIKFTTSYVSGAVVLGYRRRDQNLRFSFSAGDYMYAIGESEKEPAFDAFSWGLNGLRERDGALHGSSPGGSFEFEKPMPAFDLELLVDGAVVEARINGHRLGTYHTADGTPIEGAIGFAVSHGAVCVQEPMLERLDRSSWLGTGRHLPLCFDMEHESSRPFRDLINFSALGVPAAPNGALLVWIPAPPQEEDDGASDRDWLATQVATTVEKVEAYLDAIACPQGMILALPATAEESILDGLEERLGAITRRELQLVKHRFPGCASLDEPDTPDANRRWVFFLDASSIIRVVQPYTEIAYPNDYTGNLVHWLKVFRDHKRMETLESQ